jgi:Ca2+:H+ antiporter
MKEAAVVKEAARRAVREARVQSLQESRSAAAAAAAAIARGGHSHDGPSDIEAPLLGDRQAGHAAEAAANGSAPGLPGSPLDSKAKPDAGSVQGAQQAQQRDAKKLWALVRNTLGLTLRHHDADERYGGYVERVSAGAMQPAPSWHNLRDGRTTKIVDTFVGLFNGTGLGTGLALRSDSSLLLRHASPGVWAPLSDARAMGNMLTSSYLNILLLCLPIGIWAGLAGKGALMVFSMNFLALIPLALFLGEVTEDLAVRFGDIIGGLLNATFGNVVELLLAIAALHHELYSVVSATLLGSILSNLLLVMGTSFFVGGLKYKEQRFSTMANKVSSSLLFLACIGIMIPSTGRIVYGKHVISKGVMTELSHVIAIVLLAIYIGYLFFQLKTHADCFTEDGDDGSSDEGAALSLSGAFAALTVITIAVAICSEMLTGAIEEVANQLNINEGFLGLIVLPIAGNVTEHLTAVFVAAKNKMDLSIGIALGSSIQVALGILPLTVIASWIMGKTFILDFDQFSIICLAASVILAYFVCSDGTTNWLMGTQLIATYCLIAFIYALKKEPLPPGPVPSPSPVPGPPPASPHHW